MRRRNWPALAAMFVWERPASLRFSSALVSEAEAAAAWRQAPARASETRESPAQPFASRLPRACVARQRLFARFQSGLARRQLFSRLRPWPVLRRLSVPRRPLPCARPRPWLAPRQLYGLTRLSPLLRRVFARL